MTQETLNRMFEGKEMSPAIKKIIQRKMQYIIDFSDFMVEKWLLSDDEFESIFRDYLEKNNVVEDDDPEVIIEHRCNSIRDFAIKNEYTDVEKLVKAEKNLSLFLCGMITLDEFLR